MTYNFFVFIYVFSDTWSALNVRKLTIAIASPLMMELPSLSVGAATQTPPLFSSASLVTVTMPCVFKQVWLKDERFGAWIGRDKNCSRARCNICNKSMDISTMGTSALRSHMKGDKHKNLVTLRLQCMDLNVSREQSSEPPPSASDKSQPQTLTKNCSCKCCDHTCASDLTQPVTNYELKVADVWWALKVVASGYSYSSCNDAAFVMKQQFPDSRVAQQFSFGETKCMYTINYGIAPFCKKLLRIKLRNEPFVLMFDESPNKYLQQKQMDILVRFWDSGFVKFRFFTSTFIGHGRAVDLLAHLTECLEGLPLGFESVIQLSMDGPNVNWALYAKLNDLLQQEHGKEILNIGSCGLHTLHNSFKSGVEASAWEVDTLPYTNSHHIHIELAANTQEEYVSNNEHTILSVSASVSVYM